MNWSFNIKQIKNGSKEVTKNTTVMADIRADTHLFVNKQMEGQLKYIANASKLDK